MTGQAFRIKVQTADNLWAGTDNTVEVSMSGTVSGEKKDTGKLTLDGKGRNDHERGDKCTYILEKSPHQFEKIESLTVFKNGIDDWNLDYIEGIVSFFNNIRNFSISESYCPYDMGHMISYFIKRYRKSNISTNGRS